MTPSRCVHYFIGVRPVRFSPPLISSYEFYWNWRKSVYIPTFFRLSQKLSLSTAPPRHLRKTRIWGEPEEVKSESCTIDLYRLWAANGLCLLLLTFSLPIDHPFNRIGGFSCSWTRRLSLRAYPEVSLVKKGRSSFLGSKTANFLWALLAKKGDYTFFQELLHAYMQWTNTLFMVALFVIGRYLKYHK